MMCGVSLKECPNEKKEFKGKFDIYIECTVCHHGTRKELDSCCVNPDKIFVNFPRADSKPTKREYCRNCGTTSQVIKMQPANEYISLPLLTKEVQLDTQKARQDKNRDFWQYLENERKAGVEKRNEEFWTNYDKYLKTEEWKRRRELVFKRDNNTCQACLVRPATQVHHLTYKRIFNEPLFDLVSICTACHKEIHKGEEE